MRRSHHYLNDEHMKLYEWSGAGAGIALNLPAKSKRSHPWHASYAILASLTSLLILNGCISKPSAEQTALDYLQNKTPSHDAMTAQPVPVDAAAPAAEDAAMHPEQEAPDCGADG